MHVLVTGGAGFIGSHIVEFHLKRGDRVHVVDDLSTGRAENLEIFGDNPNLRFEQADVLTWPGLERAACWADRIYHMAAVVGVFRVLEEWLNLDLGLSASGFGYTKDLANGYYDPENYERYSLIGLGYLKLSPDSGLSLSGSAGYFRDDSMDNFEFGWSADGALTVAAYADWTFRAAASVFENLRESGLTPFRAYAASASLTRRF